VIFSLLLVIKILKVIGVIDWLTRALHPVLRILGVGKETTTIMMIGLLLGVVYGGAMIIKESKSAALNKRDIFYAFVLMGLCHSLVEDTFLMMALGAHLSGILLFRLIFAFGMTWLIVRITRKWSDERFRFWLLSRNKAK
jgi:spore maturation protein SpmB